MTDALFGDDGIRVSPPIDEDLTAGERMRRRQAANIARGYHPLALTRSRPRLHPDAPRVLSKEDAAALDEYPSCGSCTFRRLMGGHARNFPKCLFGEIDRDMTDAELAARSKWQVRAGTTRIYYAGPRASHSEATDCRAWWPACTDYQPKDDT